MLFISAPNAVHLIAVNESKRKGLHSHKSTSGSRLVSGPFLSA